MYGSHRRSRREFSEKRRQTQHVANESIREKSGQAPHSHDLDLKKLRKKLFALEKVVQRAIETQSIPRPCKEDFTILTQDFETMVVEEPF